MRVTERTWQQTDAESGCDARARCVHHSTHSSAGTGQHAQATAPVRAPPHAPQAAHLVFLLVGRDAAVCLARLGRRRERVAEGAVERGRVLGGVAHDGHVAVALAVQRAADGAHAAVHHVCGGVGVCQMGAQARRHDGVSACASGVPAARQLGAAGARRGVAPRNAAAEHSRPRTACDSITTRSAGAHPRATRSLRPPLPARPPGGKGTRRSRR